MAGGGGVGRCQLLRGGGGRQGGLQVHRLVEQFVADQHHQGEETQLEVVLLCWCLGLVSADDEEREEDGEQAATDDV